MTVHAPPAARPLPGLADRESFFAAQARHRRASWKLAALCGLSVALLGLPIAMVVSPLLIGTAILVMDLLSLVAPAPDVLAGISALMERHGGPGGWVVIYLLVALPGIAVVLPTWMVAHRLLRRGGVGGVLLGLAARAPRADDLEEHQLENVLAEMALAAGVATPRLRLLDGPGTSAAAIGNDIADATVIVSRSLLDQLDRDQTQAIVGHLVASAGNGDLRIANLILSVHATLSLLEAMAFAPVNSDVRARLRAILRAAHSNDPAAIDALPRLSLQVLEGQVLGVTGDGSADPAVRERRRRPVRSPPCGGGAPTLRDRTVQALVSPFVLTWMLLGLCRMAFLSLLTDPLASLLWRRRRFLADAAAVQLTRHPSALSQALRRLGAVVAPLPGGPWTSFLFAAGPRRAIGAKPVASFGREFGLVGVDCLPDEDRRIERLQHLGADAVRGGSSSSGAGAAFLRAWRVVFAVLVGGVWVASFALTTMASMFGFVMLPMCLIPVVGLPHVLLRTTIPWLLGR